MTTEVSTTSPMFPVVQDSEGTLRRPISRTDRVVGSSTWMLVSVLTGEGAIGTDLGMHLEESHLLHEGLRGGQARAHRRCE